MPCKTDADCGPGLRCVDDGGAEGLCGGPGDTPLCGNGLQDEGEACDDGNTADGDGCSKRCQLPVCGDGVVDPGEACDDGNTADGDACTPACGSPVCGDGFIGAGEECEDLNDVESDACTNACTRSPEAPALELSLSQTKQFEFQWTARGAVVHRLYERADVGEAFVQVGDDIEGDSSSPTVPLHLRVQASYKLVACNALDTCVESEEVHVAGAIAGAVGYLKPSNTDLGDEFGESVALSGDGNTLAVGATKEDGKSTVIGQDEDDNDAIEAGVVYVFARVGDTWVQQAYVKAFNADAGDAFGTRVALSRDGHTLAVSAIGEDGDGSQQDDDSVEDAGAVYVFVRAGETWSQQAYLKSPGPEEHAVFGVRLGLAADGNTLTAGKYAGAGLDVFTRTDGQWSKPHNIPEAGGSVALSGDGRTLAAWVGQEVAVFVREGDAWPLQDTVTTASTEPDKDERGTVLALSDDGDTLVFGAPREDGGAPGAHGPDDDGVQLDNSVFDAGAAYVFVRNGGDWSEQAYVKASNPGVSDLFGVSVALSGGGDVLAVGAMQEDNGADAADDAGAAYVFVRTGNVWAQRSYLKAPNTNRGDWFGWSVALAADGQSLAVGAPRENYGNYDEDPDTIVFNAGAVYLY